MGVAYRHYEYTDFSYLLRNNRTSNDTVLTEPAVIILPQQVYTEKPDADKTNQKAPKNSEKKRSYKQQLLDNPAMKYIYSKSTGIYHDRDCPTGNKIPSDDFEMTKDYSDEYNWCPNCRKAAIIRQGIGSDGKLLERYLEYFRLLKADVDLLHYIVIQNKAKLWIVSPTTMQFKIKDDTWRVSKREGKITLYHNNYHKDIHGNRVIDKSFHIQTDKFNNLRTCIDYMLKYSYKAHVRASERIKMNQENLEKFADIIEECKSNGFIENFFYIKNLYPFSDKFIYLDTDEYCADKYLIKSKAKIKFLKEFIVPDTNYRFIVCKVRKKDVWRFEIAMGLTSRLMGYRRNYEYFDILKQLKTFN